MDNHVGGYCESSGNILPFSFRYKANGKSYSQEAKTSPFTLLQQQAGQFIITSVSHQQKMCKAAVTDLRYNVHSLPSAQIGRGKKILQDIHEGDQAEIVFTLVGEPPFTITYQRAQLSTKKGGIPKVLETHTVSRIQGHEYSILTALEGACMANDLALVGSLILGFRNLDCDLHLRSLLSVSSCSARCSTGQT